MKWHNYPNLSLRPARPAFHCGPVQRRAKRALLALGTASTSTITQWTHRRPTPGITRSTRRALEQIGAVRVGRAATAGRPWLWRLRDSHEEGALKPRRLGLADLKRAAATGEGPGPSRHKD